MNGGIKTRCLTNLAIPQYWCGRRDLNSHAVKHWNLNPARLPVPPRSRWPYLGHGQPNRQCGVCGKRRPAVGFLPVVRGRRTLAPMVETQGTPSHWSSDISRRAVQRLKDALLGGGLESLIASEPATGEILNADARALFSSLPAVTPATAPDELVEQGLLERVPKNLRWALEQPRYRAGREVFVRASVNHRSEDPDQPAGRYDPLEPAVVTHLGRLVARGDSSFQIEVEDAPLP